MNRPVLALGLVAVAVGLLATLFADVGDRIQDPDPFEVDEKLARHAVNAADGLPEGSLDGASLSPEAMAGLLRLLADGSITLPEGTVINDDGDYATLMEDVQWTLPAGSELEDLDLTLPAGVGMEIPEGTTVDGDSLVFPPGSSLVLEDGTVLELPEGGRMTFPGMDEAALRQAVRDGRIETVAGSAFTAPRVHNRQDWDLTLPAGTRIKIPEGFSLPDGALASDMDIHLPAGTEFDPNTSATGSQSAGSKGLFDKLGDFDLTPGNGGKKGSAGLFGGVPTIAGGTWWLWILIGVVVLVAAWLLWRYRAKLAALLPARRSAAAAATARAAPVRLVATVEGRPGGLPIALAPGAGARIHLRVEAEARLVEAVGDGAAHAPGTGRRFVAAPARVELRLAGRPLATLDLPVDGAAVELPPLPKGDHALEALVRLGARKPLRARETVRVAPWDEQVARDYQALYERAGSVLPDLPNAFTPRVLEASLRKGLDTVDPARLDAMIAAFERANYSPHAVGASEWLRFAVQAQACAAALEKMAPADPPTAAAPKPAALKTAG